MEKTILISGVPVQFKCTGAFLLRFKRLTGKDPIKEIAKLETIFSKQNKEDKENEENEENEENKEVKIDDISINDLEILYEIAWVLAKSADDSIPDMIEWIESFEVFPIADIIVDLIELLQKAFSSTLTMNNKKKVAQTKK